MDQVTAIRHAVIALGQSRRWASRNFRVARGTVDRYIDGDVEPGVRRSPRRSAPKTTIAAIALEELVATTAVTKKQQLSGRRAWELLTAQGVDIGYTTVRMLMAQRRQTQAEVFIPLLYPPGDLAEVDFFEVEVDVDGKRVTAYLFLMRLMSSSRDFCWVYPRQDQTCFLDGHVRAFAHFDGVPKRVAYDNLKAAVKRHLVGGDRELTTRLAAASSAYAFEPCFCRPYQGHDKGGVEARGKNIRLQSLVPVPVGNSFDDVSKAILDDVDRRYWKNADSIERWERERLQLTTVPRHPYDARKTAAVPVSSRATVVVEGATYSVPSTWSRLNIIVHAGVHNIDMVGPRGETQQRRRISKGQRDIDYAAHYLDELSRKPQAVRQVADVLMLQLGVPFPDWWQRLLDSDGPRDAARKMARMLRGIIELGRDECERRVAQAFATNESLTTALLVPAASSAIAGSTMVPSSIDVAVEVSSVTVYDDLMAPSIGSAQ